MNLIDFYDAEAACTDDAAADVPFLLSQLPPKVDVLDVCCGTGRVAVALANAGHRVVGVDADADAIAVARRKSDAVQWHVGDAVAFAADTRFDGAVLMFNDFCLFATARAQRALLRNLHAHLRPGGLLWVDVFMPDLVQLAEPAFDQMPLLFHVEGYGAVARTSSWEPHPTRPQRLDATLQYRWFDGDGGEHFAQRGFAMTWFMPRELRRLLRSCGFRVVQQWGDHDGSPLLAESPRIILAAERR